MQSWMNTNSILSTVFTGTTSIMEYYGAFGMPTTVVVGGKDRKVLYIDTDGSPNYTAIRAAINQVLTSASAPKMESNRIVTVTPNPSSSQATITFDCTKQSAIDVALYNATGSKIFDIYNGPLDIGNHELELRTNDLASGTYYIHISINGKTEIVPLTVAH
jgi:hypothetical protein